MPPDYDPEDWGSIPSCETHGIPLSLDGTCLQCRSLENDFKFSKESIQPVNYSEDESYDQDYDP